MLHLVIILLLSAVTGAACAADIDRADDDSKDDTGAEPAEIVITARKVSEPIAAVPLSIQVLTREDIDRAGIDSLLSLAGHVPGLYVEPMWGGGGAAPTLRGQAHPGDVGAETVGIFIDGVLQANDAGDDAAMFDLERVEIIKGPQSALYGDSTFAGAINLVARRPRETPGSEFSVHGGSDDYRALSGAATGPVGRADLLGRIAVAAREFDGTGRNAAAPHDNLGGYRRGGAALNLEFTPDAAWTIAGAARISRDELEAPPESTLTGPDYNCGAQSPTTGDWSFFCGNLPRTRHFDISPDVPDSTTRTAQASLHVAWHLGAWSVDNLTTWYDSHSIAWRDWDGTSAGELVGVCTLGVNCDPQDVGVASVTRLVHVNQLFRGSSAIRRATEELRVRHEGTRVDWMAGAQQVLSRDREGDAVGAGPVDLQANEQLTALLPATPGLVGPVSVLNNLIVPDPRRIQDSESFDNDATLTQLFAVLDYRLAARATLHAELRQGLGRFGVSTPRLSVDWKTGTSGLVWLSFARGGAPGGSNHDARLMTDEQSYGAESELTWELGYRGAWWSERAHVFAAAFYNDWRNAQIGGPANTPGSLDYITRNIRGMRTPGFEVSADLVLAARWSAALGYVYDRPRFKPGSEDIGGRSFCGLNDSTSSSFCVIGPSRTLAQGSQVLVPYVDGNVLQRAPERQWNAALTWELPRTAAGFSGFVRAGLDYQGPVFVRPIDGGYDGERTLTDARIGIARGSWTLELWGSNLGDISYIRAVASRPAVFFPTTQRPQDLLYGDGRRFGLEWRERF